MFFIHAELKYVQGGANDEAEVKGNPDDELGGYDQEGQEDDGKFQTCTQRVRVVIAHIIENTIVSALKDDQKDQSGLESSTTQSYGLTPATNGASSPSLDDDVEQ